LALHAAAGVDFKSLELMWPEFNEHEDLPPGIYPATLSQIVEHFSFTNHRKSIARRLERIYRLAQSSGHVARFIIFGSFVTAKPEPNDVDIFLLMDDSFDVRKVSPEARLVFDHAAAQNLLGASVFWVRRTAAIGGENTMVEGWQLTRARNKRGILEVISL
jgi:hypothetical protein